MKNHDCFDRKMVKRGINGPGYEQIKRNSIDKSH